MEPIGRASADELNSYFATYVAQTQGNDLFGALAIATKEFIAVLDRVRPDREDFRYAEGKWSIKEVVQHVIDTERIFAFRALCFARQESSELPGFDENSYAANSGADARTLDSLVQEYKVVSASTEALFRSFRSPDLLRLGTANGSRMSARAIGWTIAGHCKHHVTILHERYL